MYLSHGITIHQACNTKANPDFNTCPVIWLGDSR